MFKADISCAKLKKKLNKQTGGEGRECNINFMDGLPDNVEITTWTSSDKTVRFIFNNTAKEQSFMLDNKKLELSPFEMKIEK